MAYRPTAKTVKHRNDRLNALLQTSVSILSKEGFQALTMSHLAREAGVATGTLYKYFDSKAQLCSETFKIASKKEVENVRAASFPTQELACETRLLNAVSTFADRAIRGKTLAYALIAEPVNPSVELERLSYRKAYASIFEQLIIEGMSTKEFPPQSAGISAAAIVGALAEALITPLDQGIKDASPEELIHAIQTFCLRAVTSRR